MTLITAGHGTVGWLPAEAAGDLNSHTAVRSGRFRGRSTPLRPRSGGLVEWRGVGASCEGEQLRQRNRFLPKNNPRIAIDGDDGARLQRCNRGQGSEHDAISDISTRNTLCDNRSVPQVPPQVSDRTLALP